MFAWRPAAAPGMFVLALAGLGIPADGQGPVIESRNKWL